MCFQSLPYVFGTLDAGIGYKQVMIAMYFSIGRFQSQQIVPGNTPRARRGILRGEYQS